MLGEIQKDDGDGPESGWLMYYMQGKRVASRDPYVQGRFFQQHLEINHRTATWIKRWSAGHALTPKFPIFRLRDWSKIDLFISAEAMKSISATEWSCAGWKEAFISKSARWASWKRRTTHDPYDICLFLG